MTHEQPEVVPFKLKRRSGPCMFCGQAALSWSPEPPKSRGFFWFRPADDREPEACWIEELIAHEGRVLFLDDPGEEKPAEWRPIEEYGAGEWSGPLVPPP